MPGLFDALGISPRSKRESAENALLRKVLKDPSADISDLPLDAQVKISQIRANSLKSRDAQSEESFLRGRNQIRATSRVPLGDPLAQASARGSVPPEALIRAADQLGVPLELQQSRVPSEFQQKQDPQIPLGDPRLSDAPVGLQSRRAEKAIDKNVELEQKRIENLQSIKDAEQKQSVQTTKVLSALHTGNKAYASAVTEGVKFLADNGIKVNPSRGIEGKIFAYANPLIAKLGYNKFFNAYEEGIRAEVPPELAKTLGGQGTGVRIGMAIINIMKQTLGKLSGDTVAEVAEQQIQTATQTWRKELAGRTDEAGNLLYPPEKVGELEDVLQEIKDYETTLVYESLMKSGAYIPNYKTLTAEDGTKYKDVPDFLWDIVQRKTGAK